MAVAMRIAGIDADSKLFAIVTIDDDAHAVSIYHKEKGRTASDRRSDLLDEFAGVIQSGELDDCDAFYIEAPIAGVNIGALRAQAYVIGAMLYILDERYGGVFLVDNGTWKKQVIGHGKASKDDIRAFVESAYDLPLNCEQDICDAAAIAQFGRIARI